MYSLHEEKLKRFANKIEKLTLYGRQDDANEVMANCLNYIFNTKANLLVTPKERNNLILQIINNNAKYDHIPQYMRLIDKDTLAIICHKIKKYDYDYGNFVYQLCK